MLITKIHDSSGFWDDFHDLVLLIFSEGVDGHPMSKDWLICELAEEESVADQWKDF